MDPTAAPVDLELNGNIYAAYPLRDIDHETMNKWVRREYMARVRNSIDGDPELQRLALSSVATMEWMQGDGLRVAMTVAGLTKLASLLCRGSKIPEEDMAHPDSISAVYDIYIELHGIKDQEPSSNGDQTGEDADPN